jgi:excisionase family DNA binding protein
MKNMTHDGYLTTTDVAKLLKLNYHTVQKMAREGRISALKIGRLWRYPPQSPAILLYKQEQKPSRKPKSADSGKEVISHRNGLKEFAKLASDIGFVEPFEREQLYGSRA